MPLPLLKLFWSTSDRKTVRLYHGDVIPTLQRLPAKSVQMAVTSPPYWRLRDYKTDKALEIGSEPTPKAFVDKMVEVFREVRRVLRDDGTLWLNLGDSYGDGGNLQGMPWRVALALQEDGWVLRQDIIWVKPSPMPESVRNRCTKAHEYVFLLTKSIRYFYDAEAIKEKAKTPNNLTRTTENGMGNGELASAEPFGTPDPNACNKRDVWTVSSPGYPGKHFATYPPKLIEPMILAGTSAHGACAECGVPWRRVLEERKLTRERPNDYVKRTGEEGTGNSCANSVAGVESRTVGWEPTCECNGRLVKRKVMKGGSPPNRVPRGWAVGEGSHNVVDVASEEGRLSASESESRQQKVADNEREQTIVEYVSDLPLEDHSVRPCVVLDPFIGSGTSCVVALEHGRHSWGVDLSERYLRENAVPRIEGALLSRADTAGLAGREAKAVEMREGQVVE